MENLSHYFRLRVREVAASFRCLRQILTSRTCSRLNHHSRGTMSSKSTSNNDTMVDEMAEMSEELALFTKIGR